MAAYGLYTHIQSNRRRSVALLIGLFVLVYVLTYAGALLAEVYSDPGAPLDWYLRRGLADLKAAFPFVTAGTLIWILIAYKFHQSMIDAVTGGEPVTRQQQPRLYNLLENLCISRGIAMPKLKVMDSDALNAFATGMNRSQYTITVTTGLLRALDDAEIEAVLGHELTHIRNGDVRMMVIAMVIAGVVSFAGELIYRILFNSWRFGGTRSSSSDSGRRNGGGAAVLVVVIALVMIALSWLLSIVIRLALSRSRESLADAGAVELTKNPDAMISALRKIEGRGELPGATSAVMEMCVDNPRSEFADLFATHPSIDARVAALVRYTGGHDPGKLVLPSPDDSPSDPYGTPEQGPWEAPRDPWGSPPPAPGHPPGPWDSPDGSGFSGGEAGPTPNPLPGPWGAPPRR